MTPGVYGDMVLGHVLVLKNGREGNRSRANDKECRLEILLVKEVQEVWGVVGGTVVVCKTPSVLCGAIGDICVANTSTTGPPTATGIRSSRLVGWAPSSYSGTDVWNCDVSLLNFGNPLLNLRAVGRRNSIKLRIIGGKNACD